MSDFRIEQLPEDEYQLIRPLLVELELSEQPHYPDHPQFSPVEIEKGVGRLARSFQGENVIFAVRSGQKLAGFCWCVLFDPGTGLEGEIAELYVAEGHRARGIGVALAKRAVELFRERGVTLGYVWTRSENETAVNLYRTAGFADTRQLVMTWYPV